MTEADRRAFEDRLAAMSDRDLCKLLIEGASDCEEADLTAGEAERRNLNDHPDRI